MKKSARVLFYCQYLLGLGHLTRSLALCETLAQDMDVDFISGGPPIERRIRSPRLHVHHIEPLLMREHDSSLYSPEGLEVTDVFNRRAEQLATLLQSNRYGALITELFPFGRGKFKGEILTLIQDFRRLNPGATVLSSVRDILVEREGESEKERRMAEMARDHYDHVLVHSDPQVITLAQTFSTIELVEEKLRYTGFVAEETSRQAAPVARRPEVLVSLGGGSVGAELMDAVVAAAPLLPEFTLRFKLSPYLPEALRQRLEAVREPNVRVEAFSTDFEAELREVALSISMGGYNTVMNVLNTRTPALIYPYNANREQRLRAELLQAKGYLDLIEAETLVQSARVASAIRARLSKPYPSEHLNLDGGTATKRLLQELLV